MRWSAITVGNAQLGIVVLIAVSAAARGNVADRIGWNTGAAFQRALGEPCDILWAGNPLRQAIASLSAARKVAILVDRRVDPGQKLDVSLKGVPLESALQTIAEGRGLGIARLGSVVYLGPPSGVENLRAVAAMLEKEVRPLSPTARRKFHEIKGLAWDDLATPRELVKQLADEAGLQVVGLDLVPHDLWAAADLPPMKLTDRLALVVVQFDLAVKIVDHGEQIELIGMPKDARTHGPTRAAPKRTPPKPRERPASVNETRIDRIVVKEKPLGPVLEQLAIRLGLELKMDRAAIEAAGISLDQRVSVRVENATVDELLSQLLKSTRLTFHRRDRVVEIEPGK